MTGFNHGMTGAVIALTVKQPLIAVPLSFLSHFAQDMIPHWNYGVVRKGNEPKQFFSRRFNLFLTADFLFSIVLMIVLALIFPAHKWLIWACMIAAACPDLIWAYYRLYLEHMKKRRPVYDPVSQMHKSIQWSQTAKGGLVEIVWFIATGTIILNLR